MFCDHKTFPMITRPAWRLQDMPCKYKTCLVITGHRICLVLTRFVLRSPDLPCDDAACLGITRLVLRSQEMACDYKTCLAMTWHALRSHNVSCSDLSCNHKHFVFHIWCGHSNNATLELYFSLEALFPDAEEPEQTESVDDNSQQPDMRRGRALSRSRSKRHKTLFSRFAYSLCFCQWRPQFQIACGWNFMATHDRPTLPSYAK